jgi:hypothetical protein
VRASGPWSGPHATLWVGYGSPHGLGQKILWAVRRDFRQTVTLRGWNVRTGKRMLFQFPTQPGAAGQRVERVGIWLPSYQFVLPIGYTASIAWHGYPSAWFVPSAGCYFVRAAWKGGGWGVPFRAVVDRMQ